MSPTAPSNQAAAAVRVVLPPVILPDLNHRAVFLAKALAHALLALEVLLVQKFVAPDLDVYPVALTIYFQVGASLVMAWWRGGPPRSLLRLSLLFDVLTVTVWIHFGGGTEMVSGPVLYVLVIGLAGILLTERASFAVAAMASIAYATLVWLELNGYLPHRAERSRPPEVQARIAAFVSLGYFTAASLVAVAARQLRAVFADAQRERIGAVHELATRLSDPLDEIRRLAAQIGDGRSVDGDALRRMLTMAQDASDLTRNVLDLARLRKNVVRPIRQDIAVLPLLHQARERYHPSAEIRGVRVEIDASASVIRADHDLLARMIENVLTTAVHRARRGTVVSIRATRDEDAAVIAVRSTSDAEPLPDFTRPPRWQDFSATGVDHLTLHIAHGLARVAGTTLYAERSGDAEVLSLSIPDSPVEIADPEQNVALGGGAVMPEESVRYLHRVKAMVFSTVLAASWLLFLFVDPTTSAANLTVAVAPAMTAALAVVYWPRRLPDGAVVVSLLADLLTMLAGAHGYGGIEAISAPVFLAVTVTLSGLVLAERRALLVSSLCVLGYAALVGLEYAGIVPHLGPPLRPPDRQLSALLLASGNLIAVGITVTVACRQMRAAFERADRLRGEAIGALSHDLKNPLHVVLGFTSLLADADPDERAEFAASVTDSAGEALGLVRGGLTASTEHAGALVPQCVPVQVNALVAQTVARFRLTAAQHNLSLTTHCAALPEIEADPELLQRAIANLLSNAIKYGAAGKSVRVHTSAEDGMVRIAVQDEGRGLSPDQKARLFEPFTRFDTTSGIEGTGIGLCIVRSIAEAHGGRVNVDTSPGRGSTFTLELPARGVAPSLT